MIKKIEKIPFTALLLTAFITVAVVFGADGCLNYYKEISARKEGTLVTKQLQVQDFVIDGMREKDGQWQTTDGDPKLMINISGMFTGIEFTAEYLVYPGDIIRYYFTQPGEGFSPRKRLYVSQNNDNPQLYRCKTPATYVVDIRLDPTTVAGNMIDFDSIIINPPHSLSDYLTPAPYHLMMWMVYSLLLAAIFRFVQEFFTKSFE